MTNLHRNIIKTLCSPCVFCGNKEQEKILTLNLLDPKVEMASIQLFSDIFDGNSLRIHHLDDYDNFAVINKKYLINFDKNSLSPLTEPNNIQKIDEILKICDCNGPYRKAFYIIPSSGILSGIDIISENELISFYTKDQTYSIYKVSSSETITAYSFSAPRVTVKSSLENFIEVFKTNEHIKNYLLL